MGVSSLLTGGVVIVLGITGDAIPGSLTTVWACFLCGLLFLESLYWGGVLLLLGACTDVGVGLVPVEVLVGFDRVGAVNSCISRGLDFLLWGLLLLEWLCWIVVGWSLVCKLDLFGFLLGDSGGVVAIVGFGFPCSLSFFSFCSPFMSWLGLEL